MIDGNFVEDQANQNIKLVLDAIGLDYKVNGEWIECNCPFHHGNNYNFKFRNGYWTCFSECNRTYSTVQTVMCVLDIGFNEALKWLCELLGIDGNLDENQIKQIHELREQKSTIKKLMKLKKRTQETNRLSSDVLNHINFDMIHPYMYDCGFLDKTIKHFHIGTGIEGKLKGRVCFPIYDIDGNIISVSGRLPNAEEFGKPKYYIVGHSQVSNTLWHIQDVIKHINEYDYIIVQEGFKSTMYMYQNGFKNCVATIGASLSDGQKNLLLKLGKPVLVICDNDNAGTRLGVQIKNKLEKFLPIYIINLDEVTDIPKASCDDLPDNQFDKLIDEILDIEGAIEGK